VWPGEPGAIGEGAWGASELRRSALLAVPPCTAVEALRPAGKLLERSRGARRATWLARVWGDSAWRARRRGYSASCAEGAIRAGYAFAGVCDAQSGRVSSGPAWKICRCADRAVIARRALFTCGGPDGILEGASGARGALRLAAIGGECARSALPRSDRSSDAERAGRACLAFFRARQAGQGRVFATGARALRAGAQRAKVACCAVLASRLPGLVLEHPGRAGRALRLVHLGRKGARSTRRRVCGAGRAVRASVAAVALVF
jgi:hypothetical protein